LLGRRLRAARLAAELTQHQLGAFLGLTESNTAAPRISRYERGLRDPDPETLQALAKALGVPVAYFHATSDVMAECIMLLARLPESKQRKALALLKKHLGAK
jgi:transcriptional regulator with XRE-family HTH domain